MLVKQVRTQPADFVKPQIFWDHFPDIPISQFSIETLEEAMSDLNISDNCYFDERVLGLELRAAYRVLNSSRPYSADNRGAERKLRRLFLRPSSEAILHSFRDAIANSSLSIETLQALTSSLAGKPIAVRKTPITGTSEARKVQFAPPEMLPNYIGHVRTVNLNIDVKHLINFFAATIIFHPFEDGNGRLARNLTSLLISEMFGSEFPLLPISPAYYMNANLLGDGLHEAIYKKTWDLFSSALAKIIKDAAEMAKYDRDAFSHKA